MTDDKKLRLGGMALRNGLLVHGPAHWAAAVRRDDGTIGVASGRKPRVTGVMTDGDGWTICRSSWLIRGFCDVRMEKV